MRDGQLFERDFEEKAGLVLDAVEEARAQLPFIRNDELDQYFAAFKRYPKFPTHEAFLEVHRRYCGGVSEEERRAARDEIVYRNARLVFSVAYPMSGRGLGLLDMLQEGAIGLMTALEKYESERGFHFSTYATHWIRQAVSRAITDLNEGRPYRITVHVAEKMWSVQKIIEKHVLEKGEWPKPKEVLEEMHRTDSIGGRATTLGQVVACMRILLEGYVSLDHTASHGEDGDEGSTFGNFVEDTRVDTESMVEARRMLAEYEAALARITSAVDQLDPRGAMVLRLRLGLGEFDAMTLEEVGERYEVTRERIRQIEVKAFSKLGEILSVTGEEIEQILAVVDELRKIAGVLPMAEAHHRIAPEDKGAKRGRKAERGMVRQEASLDKLFGLLCEHVILTPAGLRIVKAPLTTLQVRGRLIYAEAESALVELQKRGLIEGAAPWIMVQIVPEVAIPEYRAGGGRTGPRGKDLEFEDADDNEQGDGEEAPVATPVKTSASVPVLSRPLAGSQPRPAKPIHQHPARHRRRAGVILERLTYSEVYEVLVARASTVSKERVVRGAVPILENWFKIWTADATRVLEKLAEQGYITPRDGWRVIVLHYDRLDRQELMFTDQKLGVVPSPQPSPARGEGEIGGSPPLVGGARGGGEGGGARTISVPLRVIPGGTTLRVSTPAVSVPTVPGASPVQGPRHDVLDTAVRWIEQQLPHLRASLGEAHERLVKLEVACITLKQARDGHQQAAGAVESAIAEMESAMTEFFALLRQGGGT